MRHFLHQSAGFIVCLLGTVVAAQTPSTAGDSPIAPKVRVELRIGDGSRTAYRIGEIVPARITFTGTDHTLYWVGERCEQFEIFPAPVPPQTLTLRRPGPGFDCNNHGWGSNVDLTDHPVVLNIVLNRRYRLDSPGTHPLVWTGATYGDASATSNTATLTLLPRDSAWEAAELARADLLLNHPAQATSTYTTEDACMTLVYLGSPGAELDMASRYGHRECGEDFNGALRGAHSMSAVLAALDIWLHRPEAPNDTNLLRLLAFLAARRAHPEYYPDDTNWQSPMAYGTSDKYHKAAQALEESELENYERELTAALPQKLPDVRAQCIRNLLNISIGFTPTPLPADVTQGIRRQMPLVFHWLNDTDRVTVLTDQWDELDSPEMEPELIGMIDYGGGSTTERVLGLKRLMQLDPPRAHQYILDELQAEQQTLPYEALDLLPDTSLPEFDSLFLQRISAVIGPAPPAGLYPMRTEAFQLLARYASPAIEPQVRSLLDQNFERLPCEERFQLMAYLHRVDAPVADSFVLRLHFKPSAAMRPSAVRNAPLVCTLSQFNGLFWSHAIEAAEIESLNSTDPNMVISTLRLLGKYASDVARPAIFKHFQQWNERWKPLLMPDSRQLTVSDAQLDYAFLYTLGHSVGWRLSPAETAAAISLCLSYPCRNEANFETFAYAEAHPYISFISYNDLEPYAYGMSINGGEWDLASMERKITQFPPGTQFTLMRYGHRDEPMAKVMRTLGVWMSAHGFSLILEPRQS